MMGRIIPLYKVVAFLLVSFSVPSAGGIAISGNFFSEAALINASAGEPP